LEDAPIADALGEVFVGRADVDVVDAVVCGRADGGACERVVRFELNHGPELDAQRDQTLFEQWELLSKPRVCALAGLVAGPHAVAERNNDPVGRDAEVGDAAFEKGENGTKDAARCSDLASVRNMGRQREEVAKKLIRAVEEIDVQTCNSG
jgi:hypothetical protein